MPACRWSSVLAPPRARDFVDKVVARYPDLASRVKAYIRVADRRWDLRLENGVTVQLPENGEDAAMAEVQDLDRRDGPLLARHRRRRPASRRSRRHPAHAGSDANSAPRLLPSGPRRAKKKPGNRHMSWLGGQKEHSAAPLRHRRPCSTSGRARCAASSPAQSARAKAGAARPHPRGARSSASATRNRTA